MQSVVSSPRQPRERLQLPAKPSRTGPTRKSRTGFMCTCSNRPGSNKCSLHGYLVPRQKLKSLSGGNKEVINRALSPSNRRLSLRWWNFRPTPSRLSIMSTA
ncbi:hypothetical protein ACOSP7_030721 [Xanthoceras sorbifolium]